MSLLLDRDVDKMMLDKKDEKDVPILKEDQGRINQFARLSNTLQSLQSEIKAKGEESENLKDALAAVEEFAITAEEDELLRVSIGECFIHLSQEEAEERLQGMVAQQVDDTKAINDEIESIQKKMNDLKVQLYAKFGKTINLELDADD